MLLTSRLSNAAKKQDLSRQALLNYGATMGYLFERNVSETALIAARLQAEQRASEAGAAMLEAQAVSRALALEMDERQRAETRLDYVFRHDVLTELPNRTEFGERLAATLAQARKEGSRYALMLLDVDRFKDLNDSLGHRVGDLALREMAQRIRRNIAVSDLVARVGSDEFAILSRITRDPDVIRSRAEQIIHAIGQQFDAEGQMLLLTASIGITIFPDDGLDPIALQRNADLALSRSKEQGRNGYHFFNMALDTEIHRRAMLEQSLHFAVGRGELTLAFQPQIDLATGRWIGAEALSRWAHPAFGAVSPMEFVPIAERSGIITDLGRWVLHESCAQARRWEMAGQDPITMAVNMSVEQLKAGDVTRMVSDVLRETGLAPERLELEITESGVMSNLEDGIAILSDLRSLGVELAIDDFGTGYSSLSYLRQLPVHRIKIDRSFIAPMPESEDAMAITSTIVTLAHNLRLGVIAEGVETEAQVVAMRSMGCAAAQGYFFGKPMSALNFSTARPH